MRLGGHVVVLIWLRIAAKTVCPVELRKVLIGDKRIPLGQVPGTPLLGPHEYPDWPFLVFLPHGSFLGWPCRTGNVAGVL